ncbi:hypothetical protein [Microbacterium memoriense]|uniref:Mucin-associated surface protein n=1 Tax=Microbacterium memoriense TaxID=2978350 RepID=A0ABT2PC63_9MICO|nr:hypothetical protein [Microbacterium memoriense]MCT9002192.1 hypothetical protein [Microbacterium memoriense]
MTSAFRVAASVAIATFAILLAACAGPAPGLADAAGRDMQETVAAVAAHVAAGDTAAALSELDALQQRLDTAGAADEITASRAASVQRSIDLVRADLEAIAAATVPPAPAVTEDTGGGSAETPGDGSTDVSGNSGNSGNSGKDKNDNGKNDGNGNGNNGNGNGNGKGNGG